MNNNKYKVLRIDQEYDKIIKELLASSNIKSEKEYTESMLNFFKNSGLDPSVEVKSVPGEISKLRNVFVSFIREQEKKKINPLINEVQMLTETIIKFINEDALKKDDLKKFILNSSPEPESTGKEKGKAKELFDEFVSKMSSGMRGYTVDKKTVKHYENLFNALD
jgi:hypothetical protein